MAGGGWRSDRRTRIECTTHASGSRLDVGRVGARRRHLEVGARGTFPELGRQFTDAVPDAVAHAACRQSPVSEQRAAGAHCGGCGLSDRYGFQSRLSARVRLTAGSLAPESNDTRSRPLRQPISDAVRRVHPPLPTVCRSKIRATASDRFDCPSLHPKSATPSAKKSPPPHSALLCGECAPSVLNHASKNPRHMAASTPFFHAE